MRNRWSSRFDRLPWHGLLLAVLALAVGPLAVYAAFSVVPWGNAYIVTSGSMEPSIDVNSIVFVLETETYEPGDVITFERAGETITHRIVERTDRGYVTAGDANAVRDDRIVSDDRIDGIVVGTVPYYGSLLRFTRTPAGYVLFVLAPGLLLIARETASLRREWDRSIRR